MRAACKRGHPYVEGSFYWRADDGTRRCKQCVSMVKREWLLKKKAGAKAIADRKWLVALRSGA